jgi:hypothetical protein
VDLLVVEAVKAGTAQSELVEITGFTATASG